MSKHTDAARLEATRDAIRTGTAPRPRVETERVRSLAEEHPGHIGLKTIRDLALDLLDARAEVERLRKFAEKMITPCEWGPSAFIEEDEADISDWAVSCGILVERVHAQPCEVEGCECDGSPTLLYFAWSPEALALPTPAPEAEANGK